MRTFVFAAGIVAAGVIAAADASVPIVVPAAVAVAAGACGPTTKPAINDVGQVAICVEQQILALVMAGTTTFEDIAVAVGNACGPITAVEVQNLINLWTNGGSSDAGTTPLAAKTPEMQAKLKAVKSK